MNLTTCSNHDCKQIKVCKVNIHKCNDSTNPLCKSYMSSREWIYKNSVNSIDDK